MLAGFWLQEMEVVREPADFVSKKLNFYDFSLSDGGKGILGYNLSLTDAGKYLDRIPCFSCMFGQRKVNKIPFDEAPAVFGNFKSNSGETMYVVSYNCEGNNCYILYKTDCTLVKCDTLYQTVFDFCMYLDNIKRKLK